MSEEIKTLLSFNDRLHKIAESKLQSEIHDSSNKAFFEAFVLAKGFKTYEAVLLLCRSGYGEDAFVLTRTLFELMLTNAYILNDNTEDTLMRYMDYDLVTRKEMYDYIVSVPEQLTQLNAEIASGKRVNTVPEVEAEYQKVGTKYGYRNGWSDRTIKGMSATVGRIDTYSTVYKMQCTLGHTNARSMNEYACNTDEGTIFNIGPNWDLTQATLVVTFDCFFHILKDADAQFSWELSETLEALANEYAEVVGGLANK